MDTSGEIENSSLSESDLAKDLEKAKEIADNLEKVKEGSYFSFDKDYQCSNSVDRDFLKSLVEKNDFSSFKNCYLNG